MIWICAEVYIGNRHGYRLVTDEDIRDGIMKRLDAPDESVNSLIKSGKLHDVNLTGAKLPVISNGIIRKGTDDIYTFIGMDGVYAILCDKDGVTHRESCVSNKKVWNAHRITYLSKNNSIMHAYLYNNDTYKAFIDREYEDNDTFSEDKINKLNKRLALVSSELSVTPDGELQVGYGNGKDLVIPSGVVKTCMINGYNNIKCMNNTLQEIRLKNFYHADLSKCEKLHTIIIGDYTDLKNVEYNDNIRVIKAPNGVMISGEFKDRENMEFNSRFINPNSSVHKIEVGNSKIQSKVPDRFAAGLQELKDISIIGNIMTVGCWSFCGISEVNNITLGDNVIEIQDGAFATVNIDEDQKVHKMYTPTMIHGGKNVRVIRKYAFTGRMLSSSFDMRNFEKLERIDANAFKCDGMQNIVMPDTLKVVGKDGIQGVIGNIKLSKNLTKASIINVCKANRCKIICTEEQKMIIEDSKELKYISNEIMIRRD